MPAARGGELDEKPGVGGRSRGGGSVTSNRRAVEWRATRPGAGGGGRSEVGLGLGSCRGGSGVYSEDSGVSGEWADLVDGPEAV